MTSLDLDEAGQRALFVKLLWRLVPFLFACYLISYLDRLNVGIASLTMAHDIGLTQSELGFGFGVFSVGYVLCEIPSNLALHRFGARRWIARIMITWGLASTLTFLVGSAHQFYVARFLLGMAEAGFVPGIVYYLTLWFPNVWRAKAMVAFLVAVPITGVVGSPISGALLGLEGIAGLHGWQWLFIVEGVPAIVLGVLCLVVLTDRPDHAAWLTASERRWLQAELAREAAEKPLRQNVSLLRVFGNPRVVVLSLVNFCYILGNLSVGVWMPQVVKGFGLTNLQVGFVTAVPYLAGAIGMVLWARHSDRARERTWHVVAAGVLAGAALAASVGGNSPLLSMIALTLGVTGIYAFFGTFWAIPPSFLGGKAAAAGIAMIISVGQLGGLVGPTLVGWLRQTTQSFTWSFLVLAGFFLLASALLAGLHLGTRAEQRQLAR